MAKQRKNHAKHGTKNRERATGAGEADLKPAVLAPDPPAKNLSLLGISILLFGVWFIFLLITAIRVGLAP
jgi:hypothetical protein